MTDKTDSKEREVAEQWLRDRYGAYRGHFAWRELEEAFLAGRASLAASAGSEPMFWVRLCGEGLYEGPIHNARIEEVRKQSGAWSPLYLHPSPPEGMVGGWISVDERLPEPFEEVVVYPRPDDYCCEAFCDTAGKWKWAEYEHNFGVHHRECQVEYWLMLPEVPAPPTTSAGSGKGE